MTATHGDRRTARATAAWRAGGFVLGILALASALVQFPPGVLSPAAGSLGDVLARAANLTPGAALLAYSGLFAVAAWMLWRGRAPRVAIGVALALASLALVSVVAIGVTAR